MDKKRLYQYGVLGVAIVMIMASGLATIVLQEPVGTTMGYGDISKTFIVNSNDHTWVVTAGADNSGVIQSAIWDLNNESGTVYFPSGDITYSGKIYGTSELKLIGDNTVLKVTGNTGQTGFYFINTTNVTIENVAFHGNNSLSGGSHSADSSNLVFYNVTNLRILNVKSMYSTSNCFEISEHNDITGYDHIYGGKHVFIDNYEGAFQTDDATYGHGLNLDEIYDGVISNVYCHDTMGSPIDLNPTFNVSFSNIHAYNSQSNGIKMIEVVRCDFTNIYIYNITDASGLDFFDICSYINVNGLYINNVTSGQGINFDKDQTGPSHHVHIDGFFVDMPTDADAGSRWIYIDTGSHHLTFSNGDMKGGLASGVQIISSHHIYFDMVNFTNPNVHGIWVYDGSHDIHIDHCSFYGGSRGDCGIKGQNVSELYITNNEFYGWGSDAIDFTETSPYAHNFTIIGNHFKDNALAIDVHADCDYFIIMSNICYGDNIDINAAESSTRICNESFNIATISMS